MRKKLLVLVSLLAAAAIMFSCATTGGGGAAMFSAPVTATADEITAKQKKMLWSFESGTTEGWKGVHKYAKAVSINKDPKFVTEGKHSLRVDATGSLGWNQDIMVNSGPFSEDINKLLEISMDVILPPASVAGMQYMELYMVCSSKSNEWYQLKNQVMPGTNKVVFKLDNAKIRQDMWHIYLVTNNTEAYKGPIYIDNIQGVIMGQPGEVKGSVKDKAGNPIKEAYVVVGETLVKTGADGNFVIRAPEYVYTMEIVAHGFNKKTVSNLIIEAGKLNDQGSIELVPERPARKEKVKVDVDAGKVLRDINKHDLYGQNLAVWHKPWGFRDNTALERMKHIGMTMLRIPGGDYGNEYDWKSGAVYRWDGTVNWTPELNYLGGIVPFTMRYNKMVDGKLEVLPIINVMSPATKSIHERVEYAVEWIRDMKAKGMHIRFVEVGNEPDSKNAVPGPTVKKGMTTEQIMKSKTDMNNKKWWTSIKNYSTVFNYVSQRIKKEFPDMLIMGPCPMQPMNQERLEGEPWKAPSTAPYWVEDFMKYSKGHVDVLAIHEYPLWANNDARALLQKPQTTWPVYMPKYKAWMKKHLGKEIPVALTEWNSGVENVMTVMLVNALFAADYLGSYIKMGGQYAMVWDLYTQKPGDGGGHGMMDTENDPTDQFSRRATYWVFDLFYNRFGTKLIESKSDSSDLSVYASLTDDNKIAIMAINKTNLKIADAAINVAGSNVGGSAKVWTFSSKEYEWSRALYRPIINTGPTMTTLSGTGKNFNYEFPPYSITVIQLDR